METLTRDLRLALRVLRKDRVFSATAVLTLAICIGANTAIFTAVHSVLFRPLPYPEPGRLVRILDAFPGMNVARAGCSVRNYLDRRIGTDAFAEQALYETLGLNVGEGANAERVSGMAVTPSFFRVLQVGASEGRTFTDQEGEIGHDRSAIVSHAFWQRHLGGDPAAVGAEIRVRGELYTIVGVMPESFVFLDPGVGVWLPIAFTDRQRAEGARFDYNHEEVARLRPGVTIAEAQQQIDGLNARSLEAAGGLWGAFVDAGYHSVVVALGDDVVHEVRGTLYLLWGGALFVLLIAVVNIINLALVRAAGRTKEMATRRALGAGLGRLARQLVTETTLVAMAGGLAGLLVALWSLDGLTALGFSDLPRGWEIRVDGVVVAGTLGVAILLGLVVGVAPIAHLAGARLAEALQRESRSDTAGRGARLVRRALAAAQIAIAFVLLTGAGLLLASFRALVTTDPGFRPAQVLSGRVTPNANAYRSGQALDAFVARALARLRALPGVETAAMTSSVPFGGNPSHIVIVPEGHVPTPGESVVSPRRTRVTAGYFETLGIPLVRGRFFDERDTATAPRVVIVDEALAQRFWPGQDPVGRRVYRPRRVEEVGSPTADTVYLTVVGVVGAVRGEEMVDGEEASLGGFYFPFSQNTSAEMTFVVRTRDDPTRVTEAVRRAIAAVDPELPFYDVRTMTDRIDQSLDPRRPPMLLATAFAGVALLLAVVGVYGVLAYQVSQRTREVGIRMALGSSAAGIRALVLREGAAVVAIGLGVGLGGAAALRQAIAAQLFGVGPLDPRVLAIVTAVLGAAALGACLGPALRAARIDPVTALTRQ